VPDHPVLKIAGLYDSANELSSVPEGALAKADNCVVRSPHIIEPRRGQDALRNADNSLFSSGLLSERSFELFFFDEALIQHLGPNSSRRGSRLVRVTGHPNAPTSSDYPGVYEPPIMFPTPYGGGLRSRLKATEAAKSLYLATDAGVCVLDKAAGTPSRAGLPACSPPIAYLASGVGSWLFTNTAVAYRVVWGIKNAHGRLVLSEPSGRSLLINSSGSTKVAVVDIAIPAEATADWFFRIYRSEASATASTDPDDELYLVYENYPTAVQLTDGYITVVDITPETLLQEPLYTNPSMPGGILAANARPPKCRDITAWGNRVWYANTELPQLIDVQFIAPPTSGDVFTVFNQSYSFLGSSGGSLDEGDWDWYDAGATPSQNIHAAAMALVHAINTRNRKYAGTNPYGNIQARYVSGPTDAPGKLVVEALGYTAAVGYVGTTGNVSEINLIPDKSHLISGGNLVRAGTTVAATTATPHGLSVGDKAVVSFLGPRTSPQPRYLEESDFPSGIKTVDSVPSATSFTYSEGGAATSSFFTYVVHKAERLASADDRAPNRIFFSKRDQPEAVPRLNYLEVGVPNFPILRVVPLRDRLFVFKGDGIFTISGEYPFRADLVDDTVRLVSPDTVAAVNNSLFALTDQGVVAITDGGVRVVSRPIERTLLPYTQNLSGEPMAEKGFAVSYEADRQYILWPGGEYDDAYVYSAVGGVWTKWLLRRTCGRVDRFQSGLLYSGVHNGPYIQREKKGFASPDYADTVLKRTVSSYSRPGSGAFGYLFFTAGTGTPPPPGSWVTLSTGSAWATGRVSSSSSSHVLLTDEAGTRAFEPGDEVYIHFSFKSEVEWLMQAPGGPNQLKQFAEVTLHFRNYIFYESAGVFASDLSPTAATAPIVFSDRIRYHPANIQSQGWLGRVPPRNKRVLVPKTRQLGAGLLAGFRIEEAGALWSLNGITLHYNHTSERNSK
jgi:hypothetical protein